MLERIFGRTALAAAIACLALLSIGAATAGAAQDPNGLIDISHQMGDIQHKLADLKAHGRFARTGDLAASATCGYDSATTVFAPWGDGNDYWLAPGGDLAGPAGWTLTKSAAIERGSAPGGGNSLVLPADGEAATPAMCISEFDPSIRFFAQNTGKADSKLKIDLLYEDVNGHVQHITIARLRGSAAWNPTVAIPIYINAVAAATENGVTAVAFAFKAEGLDRNGGWRISNLYVDPFRGR
ncbi:MAG TPA: hypothetical protein VGF23_02710 [Gaiellaceae bacterium]